MPLLALAWLAARPVSDVDIFWQVRLGEIMLDTHRLVLREPFAASHLGEPLVPLSALAQLLLALARRLGGWQAVQGIDALAWSGGFLAAGLAARARGGAPLIVALALALCLVMALPFSGVRPQSFAVLGLGLILLLLARDGPLIRTAMLGLAVLVLWQNLHPSAGLAAVYLIPRAGLGWLRWRSGHRADPPWAETLLIPLAGLAVIATPAGFAVFPVSASNARMSVLMGASEWLSPFAEANRAFLPGLLGLNLFAMIVLWWRRRELDGEALAGAIVLLILALTSGRFVLFWALALVPALAGTRDGAARTDWRPIALFLAGASAIGLALGWRAGPSIARDLPSETLEALSRRGVKGTIYASYPFGGLVVDRGYPQRVVAFDGRYYRYTAQEWRLCQDAMAGRVSPGVIVARFRPTAWLLSPALDQPLIAALRANPAQWRPIASDRAAILFVPVRSRP